MNTQNRLEAEQHLVLRKPCSPPMSYSPAAVTLTPQQPCLFSPHDQQRQGIHASPAHAPVVCGGVGTDISLGEVVTTAVDGVSVDGRTPPLQLLQTPASAAQGGGGGTTAPPVQSLVRLGR
jgi:hypothetical protein